VNEVIRAGYGGPPPEQKAATVASLSKVPTVLCRKHEGRESDACSAHVVDHVTPRGRGVGFDAGGGVAAHLICECALESNVAESSSLPFPRYHSHVVE
jgi:hypothetical protein